MENILFYSYILLLTLLLLYSEVIIPFCAMFKVLFSFRNFVSEIIRKLSMEGFFWCFHLFVNCGDFCWDFSESGVKLVAIHWNSHMLSERTDWFIDVWKAMLYSWQLCAVSKFAKLNEMNQQRFDQSISITMSRYVCDTTTVLARGSYMRDPMHNAAVALLHLHSRACALFCSLIFLSICTLSFVLIQKIE